MRKKHTFLLTVFPSEESQSALKGRLQLISTGSSYTFTNLEEMQQIISKEIREIDNTENYSGPILGTKSLNPNCT
jgi:hypothetical protein